MSRHIVLAANKQEAEHAAYLMGWKRDGWTHVIDEMTLGCLRPGSTIFTYGSWWAHPDASEIERTIDAREICCVRIE